MSVVVVVGAQWGDEGKGKIVDLFTSHADMVVRYGGGANAGHTLVVGGEKVVLHLVPSGVLHSHTQCVLAQGTVVDPNVLLSEIRSLRERSLLGDGRFWVSDRAHIVLPQHMIVDGLREQGRDAIGTTRRGIGPAYEDKAARRGLRIGDLLDRVRLEEKLAANLEIWRPIAERLGGTLGDSRTMADSLAVVGEELRSYVTDSSVMIGRAIRDGKRVLLEGAQGTLLDIDHGTYPYVTSSSATAGGACTGAGIGPTTIDTVVGITKAYTTRVGGGPFPTELLDSSGDMLRDRGHEYGSTTGRPRRCGWLDVAALRYAVRINGIQQLAITKLDVLTGIHPLRVCTAYEVRGQRHEELPICDLEAAVPIYTELDGWDEPLEDCRRLADLPENAAKYVRAIQEWTGCELNVVSVSPARENTIVLQNPLG